MRLQLKREDVQQALQRVQGIVERKTTMPILSHFLIKAPRISEDSKEEIISIAATDLEVILKEPMRVVVLEPGSLCIPARKLFEIVRELEQNLVIETIDNNWIKVISGRSTFKLAGLPEEDFPSFPEMEQENEFSIQPEILKDMIDKTIYAIGEGDARYAMHGLLFHFVNDDTVEEGSALLRIVGTDGHRMSMLTTGVKGRKTDIFEDEGVKYILPKKTAAELKNLLQEKSFHQSPDTEDKDKGKILHDITIAIKENHLSFTIPDMNMRMSGFQEESDILLSTRLIDGTYPDYEQVLPLIGDVKAIANTEVLYKALKRVSIMSRERTSAVKFCFESDKLRLTSTNPDLGEAHDEISLDYGGEQLCVGFNARFVMDALAAMKTDEVFLFLKDAESPVLLKEEEDSDYKCVVMPMRI
jgi:DNA polymerase-3 subunit beta